MSLLKPFPRFSDFLSFVRDVRSFLSAINNSQANFSLFPQESLAGNAGVLVTFLSRKHLQMPLNLLQAASTIMAEMRQKAFKENVTATDENFILEF